MILAEDNIVVIKRTNQKFGDTTKQINIYVPDTKYFENYELLRKPQRELIEKIANTVIGHVFEVHLKYRDMMPIDYSNLKNITPYLNKHNEELYKRMIGYKQKETYDNHNNKFREIYKDKSLSSNQRSKLIDNEMDKLKSFLNTMINNLPETMENIKADVKERKERKRNTLKKS